MGEDEADGTARGQSGSEVLASAKLAATSHVLAIIVWAFFSGPWWSKYIVDMVSNIYWCCCHLNSTSTTSLMWAMKDWQLKPKSGYIQELSGKLLIWFVWSFYIWYYLNKSWKLFETCLLRHQVSSVLLTSGFKQEWHKKCNDGNISIKVKV